MSTEQEKRDLILAAFRAGQSATTIAKIFKATVSRATVSRATVFRTIKASQESGRTERKVQVRQRPVRTAFMKKRI